jgi:hypothetical protein
MRRASDRRSVRPAFANAVRTLEGQLDALVDSIVDDHRRRAGPDPAHLAFLAGELSDRAEEALRENYSPIARLYWYEQAEILRLLGPARRPELAHHLVERVAEACRDAGALDEARAALAEAVEIYEKLCGTSPSHEQALRDAQARLAALMPARLRWWRRRGAGRRRPSSMR